MIRHIYRCLVFFYFQEIPDYEKKLTDIFQMKTAPQILNIFARDRFWMKDVLVSHSNKATS